MSYSITVTERSIVFYADDELNHKMADLDITGKRLDNALKNSVPKAVAFRLFERCTKHDSMGRYISTFSRFKLYRRSPDGKYTMVQASAMTL